MGKGCSYGNLSNPQIYKKISIIQALVKSYLHISCLIINKIYFCHTPSIAGIHFNQHQFVIGYRVLQGIHLCRGFINVCSKRATCFHKQVKLLQLNIFMRKTFLSILLFEAMYFSVRYLIPTIALKTSKLGLLAQCRCDQICNFAGL